MKWGRLLILLGFVLAAGCITTELPAGSLEEYELPGINNTTIYYLNGSSVQVVDSVMNETTVRLVLDETGEMNLKNPIAVDYSGKNVTFTTSIEPIFGKSYVKFEFESPFSGFIAYTQSDGQDFSRMLIKNGSVHVVLPVNFTTGSRFLGIASPEPDSIITDSSGREVLIWEAPYPKYQKIEVRYYHKSALMTLYYIFTLLFACIAAMLGYYYLTLRALRKKREMMEKSMRK